MFGLGDQRNEGVKAESEAVWHREEWSERSEHRVNVRVTQNTSASSRGSLSTITPGISLNFEDKYFLHLKKIYNVAFSPDAQTLASGSADQRVRFETRSIVR